MFAYIELGFFLIKNIHTKIKDQEVTNMVLGVQV